MGRVHTLSGVGLTNNNFKPFLGCGYCLNVGPPIYSVCMEGDIKSPSSQAEDIRSLSKRLEILEATWERLFHQFVCPDDGGDFLGEKK